jgi:hypothetical protein
LLDHDVTEARTLVESWLPLPLAADSAARDLARTAARLLIQHTEDLGWFIVWPAIQSDADFGMSVVESTFGGFGSVSILKLPEDQVADFYIWLVNRYP